MSFEVLPLASRISLLAVVPWPHHLVMILPLIQFISQQNRFCDASKRVRPLIGASNLRRIYIYIYIYQYSNMPATYYIHIGLQWKVGDQTTLQTTPMTCTWTKPGFNWQNHHFNHWAAAAPSLRPTHKSTRKEQTTNMQQLKIRNKRRTVKSTTLKSSSWTASSTQFAGHTQ